MNRRIFLKNTALSGVGAISAPHILNGMNNAFTYPLTGKRFVTLCIMIRTSPWEVSRDVKLHPRDEVDFHTLDYVCSLREAFAKNNPAGRLTWGFTLNALEDQRKNFREIRDLQFFVMRILVMKFLISLVISQQCICHGKELIRR